MLIHKNKISLLTKFLFKRTFWDMLRSLTTHAMLPDKNIKSKVLLIRLNVNGKIWMSVYKHIKKHGN
jgi:hypothetical protein